MEQPIGGGFIGSIKKPHFWKAVVIFILLVGGIWGWHYYKIRHDVRAQINNADFDARQPVKIAPSRN